MLVLPMLNSLMRAVSLLKEPGNDYLFFVESVRVLVLIL